ncbi:SDR family oxidoreductase [Mycetocola spongiae]|uniref:SDR family oxidoreductase n=1 Tax=Mycetocola spongiae TaxID=2859226 RepID=UPI001CF23F99|nr:SDR family oxidoreductase [Mycetocola spongiae]UCR89728.1 SDR family oxidoreductase [Mycetocola spongiae]
MSLYVVTGSGSGMGRASAEQLIAQGHEVLGIDLRDADIIADLSTAEGRAQAVATVLEKSAGRLDGAVLAAGVGPIPGREMLTASVNYLGVTELLLGLRPALAAAGNSKVVVYASNAATTTPGVPDALVSAFLDNNLEAIPELIAPFGEYASALVYGASKLALSRWLRRTAVTPEWAGSGIRLNAIAPGAILTPLLQSQLDGPNGDAVRSFPIPIGSFGSAEQIAAWTTFMLSPAADFMAGAIVFVDGGTDALIRANDWPVAAALPSA